MSSGENLHSPLLMSRSSEALCDEIPSPRTAIILIPNPTPPVSSMSPFKINGQINNEDELDSSRLHERQPSTRTILMASISYRLRRRKCLHNRLSATSSIMCFLGILGIVLMIIENEITFMTSLDRDTYISWSIRFIISITTVILVGFVFYYHRLDLILYAVTNSLDHWRIGLTGARICLVIFEVLICMIHPVPRNFSLVRNTKSNSSTISDPIPQSYIAIDVILGLPMFARVYLICRCIMFHSHLFRDASSQSLGSLSQVSFNFFFLIKTYLTQWPTRCLLVFCVFLFLTGSWSLRACNYQSSMKHLSMFDSMWLFIVTFTTVGYGDLTPSTYCGRCVAAITALIGVLSTALLISVLAQKLELTRSEKYVHNFVLNIGFAKQRKIQAANVIKFAIKLWYLKRKHQPRSFEYILIQRRLFQSVHLSQQLKQEQRKLIDSCIGLPELISTQRDINEQTQDNTQRLATMNVKVDRIEEKLVDMNQTMTQIQKTLDMLLNKISDTTVTIAHRPAVNSSSV